MAGMNRLIAKWWLCVLCLFGGNAWATAITFTAVDVADTVPGQDLWQYRYTVNGSFAAFDGFNLEFDAGLYTLLQDPAPAPNGDWSVLISPDFGLGVSRIYAATALTPSPSLTDQFTLDFVWLGTGAPGSQPFEVFDGNFNIVEVGRTNVPRGDTPVPAPATLVLVASGLMLLRRTRKSKVVNPA
jgi:hypothetical protein